MKLPHRRQFLHLAAGAVVLPALPHVARAQRYDAAGTYRRRLSCRQRDRPRRAHCWSVVGEAARPASQCREPLGGEHQYATEAVVRAPADGYTLLVANTANAINATLYDKLNFNFIRDITPVAGVVSIPIVLVVNPSLPAKTVPESSPSPRPIPVRSPRHRPSLARCRIWLPLCSR